MWPGGTAVTLRPFDGAKSVVLRSRRDFAACSAATLLGEKADPFMVEEYLNEL